jgi:hypothetical protein
LDINRFNIKNLKICLPITLVANKKFGQKIFKRKHPSFKREYFVANIFFQKHVRKKMQKFIFKENIATIITTTSDYNFEETSKNVSLEQSKLCALILKSCHKRRIDGLSVPWAIAQKQVNEGCVTPQPGHLH